MNLSNISYQTPQGGSYTYGAAGVTGMSAADKVKTEQAGRAQEAQGPDKSQRNGLQAECQTCKNRKYQDGSDELVSFKAPTRLSPERAASAVRTHEQEHVSNAYSSAAQKGGKVLSATVSIHMGVCPECGRSYVSGGTTRTQIKYPNEENPYQQEKKAADKIRYGGANADYAV